MAGSASNFIFQISSKSISDIYQVFTLQSHSCTCKVHSLIEKVNPSTRTEQRYKKKEIKEKTLTNQHEEHINEFKAYFPAELN